MIKLRDSYRQIRGFVAKSVKENWGFPFITGFILLLFAAAVFLATSTYFASIADSAVTSANFASWAESTATLAYFALVVGVVFQLGNVNSKTAREAITLIKKLKVALQLVCFRKDRLKNGAVFHGSG